MKKRLRQRWIVNLVLFIIISSLAVFIWHDQPPVPDKRLFLGQHLPNTLSSITITRPGKHTIRFQKHQQGWHMTAPYDIDADTARINSLLDLYSAEITSELKPEQSDLAQFGLKDPAMQISFNNRSIFFGDTQPVGKRRYAMVGDQVYLVADNNFQLLNSSSTTYIDRHLVPRGKTLAKIIIGDRQIEKAADGWLDSMNSPQKDVAALIDQWTQIKANWLTVAGRDDKEGTPVVLTFTGQQQQLEYLFKKKEPGHVLVQPASGLEYHLSQTSGEHLGLIGTDHQDQTNAIESGN